MGETHDKKEKNRERGRGKHKLVPHNSPSLRFEIKRCYTNGAILVPLHTTNL